MNVLLAHGGIRRYMGGPHMQLGIPALSILAFKQISVYAVKMEQKEKSARPDWLRNVLYVSLSAFLISRVYASVQKMLEGTQSTEIRIKDEPALAFPSVTFCPLVFEDHHNASYNLMEDYARVSARVLQMIGQLHHRYLDVENEYLVIRKEIK